MSRPLLVVDPGTDGDVLKAMASPVRVSILKLLNRRGATNINAIAALLDLPQSSVSANVQTLEKAGLVETESRKARKGNQKICRAVYEEFIVTFKSDLPALDPGHIDVSMPLGLYTSCNVTGPCGICAPEGIIGLLDVPETFLDPERMRASLLWFTSGYVEYQFPNNAKLKGADIESIEFSMELSSQVPGTRDVWPSDITLSVNGVELGDWTSPGDFGDRRGRHTPPWWKLSGSQYGMLKHWSVNGAGSYVDGVKISNVRIADLGVDAHRSIRLRVAVKPEARHPGGVNIFGRGFGNYDQDIVLSIRTRG